MSAETTIATVTALNQHGPDILAAINGAPRGAELFIADPFRYLSEHGFAVSPAVQAELQKSAPALAKTPKELYDGIEAGRAALISNATLPVTWHISSLGVTL
jgi:hypothetical protein